MSRRALNALLALAVADLTFAIDQLLKTMVRADIEIGQSVRVVPGLDLVYVKNTGVAFGFFSDSGAAVVAFGVLLLGLVLYFFVKNSDSSYLWLPVGLLVGGTLGNLFDRIKDGWVTDYIDLPLWPAFNIADVAIVVGILGLAVIYMRADAKA